MKKFILTFIALISFILIAGISATYYFFSNLDKNFIVKQIESKLNLRAELKDLKLNLFNLNPEIELIDFKISERDEFANKAIPILDRTELKNQIISVQSVGLKLNLHQLLSKEFKVAEMYFKNPKLDFVLFENGGNNLKNLFKKPQIVNGIENPDLTEKEKKKESTESFKATDLPVSIYLDSFKIENASIQVFIAKNKNRLILNPANFEIRDFKLNKNNLESENELSLNFGTNLFLKDSENKDSLELKLRSSGKLNLFDKSSLLINPFFVYDVTVLKSSYLTSLPAFDILSKKLPILNQIGLEIPFLSEKLILEKDVNTKISYSSGVIQFLKSVIFPLQKFDFALLEKSKFNIINKEHFFRGSSILNKEETEKSISKIESYISSKNKIPELNQVKEKLLSSIIENEQLKLDFISEGLINSPKLSLENQVPDLKSILKETAINKAKETILEKGKEKLQEKLKNKLPIKLPF